jgi:integrase
MSEDNPTTLVPPGKSDADPGTTPPTPATRSARIKPPKPYPDFPLFPHDAGVWAKKIRGKMHYFGRWDDPDGALKKYLEQKDDLHAGPTPASQTATEAATVKDVGNAFLNAKAARVESGELSQRMFLDYKETCDLVVSHFGKNRPAAGLAPGDFDKLREKMAKRWGPVRLGNVVQRVRTVFKYAHDSGLLPFPMRFGPGFCRPTKKTMRLHRAAQGPKLFTAEEVRRLIDAADVQVQAMLLLGINAGFGNTDCASLPLSALDLEHALIDFPRPKTGIARRCPLWPETVEAIRAALASRQEPKDPEDANLVFLTARGGVWDKNTGGSYLSWKLGKMLRRLGINGRKGLGFYTLRHTFRTVADEARDQPAADFIMGHEISHMSTVYQETISEERLKAVTDYVRKWLFAEPCPVSSSSGGCAADPQSST